MKINISEIFASIQGEGRYTGHPAIFIRMAGCSGGCSFCDTKHANKTEEQWRWQCDNLHSYNVNRNQNNWCTVSVDEVYEYTRDLIERSGTDRKKRIQMIVITGGEPFEQPEALGELLVKLPYLAQEDGGVTDYVQLCIESSGTPEIVEGSVLQDVVNYVHAQPHIFLTVSPKPKPVRMEYIYASSQLKFLVGCVPVEDARIPPEVLEHLTERSEALTFQPIWYANEELYQRAIERTIEKAYQYGGTVSIQVHKCINIR